MIPTSAGWSCFAWKRGRSYRRTRALQRWSSMAWKANAKSWWARTGLPWNRRPSLPVRPIFPTDSERPRGPQSWRSSRRDPSAGYLLRIETFVTDFVLYVVLVLMWGEPVEAGWCRRKAVDGWWRGGYSLEQVVGCRLTPPFFAVA